MSSEHPRIRRERRTIEAMIQIYCREQHASNGVLCAECEKLRAYANQRLDKCPFQEQKTTCVNCPVHCYQATMRERVRQVMRFSGPRMLWRHPYLAVMHLAVDGRRKPADLPKRRKKSNQ